MFFTADFHFGHPLLATLRGFQSSYEMDEVLIDNYLSCGIKDSDHVYILGDFSFRKPHRYVNEILGKLPGRKFLLVGNHDKATLKCPHRFEWISPLKEIKFRDEDIKRNVRITLCHYCMRTWPASHRGSYHLFGHSHGELLCGLPNDTSGGLVLDVGVDCWGLKPIPYSTVLEVMLNKERKLGLVNRI